MLSLLIMGWHRRVLLVIGLTYLLMSRALMAKAGPTGDRTHVSTQVSGTYGYAAPEYVTKGS